MERTKSLYTPVLLTYIRETKAIVTYSFSTKLGSTNRNQANVIMEALNVIVFSLNTTPSAKLQNALPGLDQNRVFLLPQFNASNLSENRTVTRAVQLAPQAVLIEIGGDYQYQNFIELFQSLFKDNPPQIIGVLDGKPGQHETSVLTQLNIDSYLFSDWSPERMQAKLTKLNKLRIHNNELREQMQNTAKTAATAMKAASEIGLLMQLMEWLQTANALDEVALCLFKLCRCLELNAVAMIMDNTQREFFPQGMVNDSAIKILSEAHQHDIRVLSRNRIHVFRLDYLVLMITNAPWQDEEKCGRFRDILLQAAAQAEAKARTIIVNNLIISQVGALMSMIKNLSADTQKYTREIMQNWSEDLAMSAISLDLTEEQEAHLLKLSDKAQDSIEVLYQSNNALELHFHKLISSITQVRQLTGTKEGVQKQDNACQDDDDITLF